MWTPKRVVLLALGFALLFASYLVYAHYLGGIDGLPPLPESCWPSPDPIGPPEPKRNWVDERLAQAFGEGCVEVRRPIRLEIHSKGMVLSTDDFHIMRAGERDTQGVVREGQVRLQPLSLALFSKKTQPGQYPEITTVRAKTAYLTFDRPIGNWNDMAKAKIVGAELYDKIEIVNNRRKPRSSNDELHVFIPTGPVHYRQRPQPTVGAVREPDVWTKTTLELKDYQSKPNPTLINAEGMELFLTADTSAPAAGPPPPRKPRNDTVSGVERIVLLSNVRMDLYTDPRSGFLSTGDKPAAASPAKGTAGPPAASAAKVLVIIHTPGTFVYDVPKDLAVFDVPKDPGELSPHRVHVTRVTKPTQHDQLYCDRLELQFRRKKPGEGKAAPAGDDRSVELEIETAHATGKDVTLASDAEILVVQDANEFLYNAATRETLVTGTGEIAVLKEGHALWAPKLRLRDDKGVQQMTASGPGRISLLDKESKKRSVTASWKDTLVSLKDGDQDLLTLTGDARFQDTEHDQTLNGDEIKVWLEPSGRTPAPAAPPAGPSQNSRRPQRVEATGHVVSRSPEMNIHDTDKLVLTFRDAVPSGALPGGASVSSNSASAIGRPTAPDKPVVVAPPVVTPGTPPIGGTKPEPAKPARPIDLSAHHVEARVLRQEGGKNELDRLWTEGQVRVHQAPEKPDEQGLDIKGDTLELIKQPEGNRLVVTGDVAELQIDKLFIRGPQVEIDQADNEAWVKGVGALTMKTRTSFNGNPLDHEVDMTIYWSKYMHFKGSHAQFTGSIQAEQENAQLACQSLQVDLDRPISFREGQKNGPPAKVDRMVCDRSVMVQDSEFQNGKCVKYQRIECRELIVDNTDGKAHGTGPGTVRLHQRGDAGSPLAPAPPPAAPARPTPQVQEQEMKLTIIQFGGRMWADNNSHTAIFSDNIEVIHLATEDKDLQPDLDRLPRGAVYLRCADQLKVRNRPENGKSNQELEGTGNVRCDTQEYIAQCEKVTYNEGKDQLIFDGGEGWAHLRKLTAPGGQQQQSDAKQFIYLRKTGEIKSINARGVSGATSP